MTQITGVAVRSCGVVYSLPKPNRHHHVLRKMSQEQVDRDYSAEQEGFITESGDFLSRKEAYQLAIKTGQINRRAGIEFYQGDKLFSEDLW